MQGKEESLEEKQRKIQMKKGGEIEKNRRDGKRNGGEKRNRERREEEEDKTEEETEKEEEKMMDREGKRCT